MDDEPETIRANHRDEWTCLCGNTANDYGFYPVNDRNEEVEPMPDVWTTNHYACFKCGRIIDQDSRVVVRTVPMSGIRRLYSRPA
jgi:hypothetical protein